MSPEPARPRERIARLEDYATHRQECPAWYCGGRCTCGLDALLAAPAGVGQDPLYSIAPDGTITIVQCGACADLRAQLETAQARVEALLFAENRAIWAKQDAEARSRALGTVVGNLADMLEARLGEWECDPPVLLEARALLQAEAPRAPGGA